MATRYAWKDGGRRKTDAQVAGEEISRLRDECGGFLKPATLVEASRPADAPLHPEFEWNDALAAIEHRKHQASHIIQHVVISAPENEDLHGVRAFVSVKIEEAGRAFTSTAHAVSDDALRFQVLEQAKADMLRFRSRYRTLLDLSGVAVAFDKALGMVAHERL